MPSEQIVQLIGKITDVQVFEVEKGAIKKFADAVDDPNPLYWDEEYARNSRYDSLIAPPGFFGWPVKWKRGRTNTIRTESAENVGKALTEAGYSRSLDGGVEYEFFAPIRAGDTLVASSVTKDIIEREGRTGKLVLVITETTYINQKGELVAKAVSTGIRR